MLDTPAMPAGECEKETAHKRIFKEFMAGVARFEELVDGGRQFLARFQQELDYFRRPPVESDVIGEIVRSNCTDRMKSYLESGCSLPCQSISNLSQYPSSPVFGDSKPTKAHHLCNTVLAVCKMCENGDRMAAIMQVAEAQVHSGEAELQGYINKVNALVEELQCLVEDAYAATLTANLSATQVLDYTVADNSMNDASHFTEEKEEQPADQLDRDSSLVMVMILVHNMLKLDYTMQEKIVMSLSLKSSSAELQSYCLMWDLRPYVDGKVMDLAWKSCP